MSIKPELRDATESLLGFLARQVRRLRPELLEGVAIALAAFTLAAAGGIAFALAAGCVR